MADVETTQPQNGGGDPIVDDSEEADSKVRKEKRFVLAILMSNLLGNFAHEATCGRDGERGKKTT